LYIIFFSAFPTLSTIPGNSGDILKKVFRKRKIRRKAEKE
jgi:hypothetical protein